MHPASGALLAQHQQAALERAGGACERCGGELPADTVPCSPIDGLPTVDQLLVLCPACEPEIMRELVSIASIPALTERMRQLRR